MKKRSVFAVLLLPFITLGIYSLYWEVKSKGEMNTLGADIPTAWLIIIPFVNIWWLWRFSKGVERVTQGKMSGVVAFLLLWLLGFIGQAIVQDAFNNVGAQPAVAGMPSTGQPYTPVAPQFGQAPATPQTNGYPQVAQTPTVPQPSAYPQTGSAQVPQPQQPPTPPNPPLVSG